MGDGESSANNSCRSSPISLAEHSKMTDSINMSRESSPQLSDSVKEEENTGNGSKSSSCGKSNKPSAQLSFSIARLINTLPSANDNSPISSPAPDNRPSASSSTIQHPPVYPIPMWAPTSTTGNNAATTRPSAFAPHMMPSYFAGQQPFADAGNNGSLNQMLRNVLMHQPSDALATLMRHYQQQFYATAGHPLQFGTHPVGSLPPPLNLSANSSSGTSSAANLQKVEILRSAASASLYHQQNRPSPLLAPHRLHGKHWKPNHLYQIISLQA